MSDSIYIVSRKLMYKDLQPLWDLLENTNYAVIKGEAISQQIYGVPNLRSSGDIDLLIDKQNINLIENELKRIGYEQISCADTKSVRAERVLCLCNSHQIPSYHKTKYGFHFNVDINHDIFWGEYEGSKCSMENFLSDVEPICIYGVTVKTLSLEKSFVQLILHHYKEMNSLYHLKNINYISTHMFKDIYDMLILNNNILNIDKILELSSKYLIGDIVYYMLYYTYHTFLDDKLVQYLVELEKFKNAKIMDCYGLCTKERKSWNIPFEQRLDNDEICSIVCKNISESDMRKISLGESIFT